MSHQANCQKCKTEVKWTLMTDRVLNLLEDGLSTTGILVWNKADDNWRIICKTCLQKIAFR